MSEAVRETHYAVPHLKGGAGGGTPIHRLSPEQHETDRVSLDAAQTTCPECLEILLAWQAVR